MTDANDLPSSFRGILWSATFASAGAVSGVVIEAISQKALRDQTPLVRGIVQFVIGVATLGPILQFLLPREVDAPVGDGILMVFFYYFQPSLMRDIASILQPIYKAMWKDVPVADKLAIADPVKQQSAAKQIKKSVASAEPTATSNTEVPPAPTNSSFFSGGAIPDVGLVGLQLR